VDETQFIEITLWARTAEVASEYLSKGSSVLIEGRLKLDRWEKDGEKHSKLRVVGEKMQMLGGRSGTAGGGGPASSATTATTASSATTATSVAEHAPHVETEPPQMTFPSNERRLSPRVNHQSFNPL